jgi:hypothetical protein
VSAAPSSVDDLLLGFVVSAQRRILASGQGGGHVVKLDDLAGPLEKSGAAGAAAVEQARVVVGMYNRRCDTARANLGDFNIVARAMAARLSEALAAFDVSCADPAALERTVAATAALDDAGSRRAAALAQLEHAVVTADLDEVMRLRPLVEVTLPNELDAARLEAIDAEISQIRDVVAASKARGAVAQARLAAAEADVQAARDALARAESALDAEHGLRAIVETAPAALSVQLRELEQQRQQLAATIESDAQARFRRLAGLPDRTEAQMAS